MTILSWKLVEQLLQEEAEAVRAEVEADCALRYGAVTTARGFALYQEMGRRLERRQTRQVVRP